MIRRETKKVSAHCRGKSDKGFTLLLAALISSIVLVLGMSIFSIAFKQVSLSSMGRDSQYAFYAADAGAECALYWDARYSAFATSSYSAPMGSISCDQISVTPSRVSATASAATSSFQINIFSGKNCVEVTVAKYSRKTAIRADGYSTSCETILTSGRALQRSVELRY